MKLNYLKRAWKKPIVYRDEIEKFTQGIYSNSYQAVLDHKGQGPKRYLLGGKIAYRVGDYIKWLEQRMRELS